MEDGVTESKPVRLTATAPTRLHADSGACQSGQCQKSCCNHGTAVPKLPFAEPIEPPPTTQPPPPAIVNQPLTPIVLRSPNQQGVSLSNNGLRSGTPLKNGGRLRSSQIVVPDSTPEPSFQAEIATNPIRIGNLHREEDLRTPEVKAEPLAPELIVSSLDTQSRRRVAAAVEPIPPFADCPPPDAPSEISFEPRQANHAADDLAQASRQVVSNDFSLGADSFAPPTASTQDQGQSTIRIEDLSDEEFNELFGIPGVAVNQELKQLLKQRIVCDACGKFECTGCFAPDSFAPDSASTAAGQVVEVDFEADFSPSQPERPVAEPEEPLAFIPFDGTINSLESKFIPASHQETAVPNSAAAAGASQVPEVVALRLLHPEFCTEINGFGQITRFPNRNFSATQRVLVYCEVENHESVQVQTSDGDKFLTRLRGSYAIVDEQGSLFQQGEFPHVEDMALNKRRDFFLYFPIAFQDLPSGNYRLELQVEDLTANRAANVNPSLQFTVE